MDIALHTPCFDRHELNRLSHSLRQLRTVVESPGTDWLDQLLALHPRLGSRFGHDRQAQGRLFFETLAVVLPNLNHPALLQPWLRRLGARHVRYGVLPGDFERLRHELMAWLAQALDAHFDPGAARLWGRAFDRIRELMGGGGLDVEPMSPRRTPPLAPASANAPR